MLPLSKVLRSPFETGAIAPSSPYVAKHAVEMANVRASRRVIELGPGNGVITRRILGALPEGGRLLAIERNREFSARLATHHPSVTVVCDCATRLENHAARNGFTGADCVVSALPWWNFRPAVRREVIAGIQRTLSPAGTFVTIACFGLHWLPPGRDLRNLLRASFASVSTSPVVLANVPPAFLYVCHSAT